MGSIRFTCYMQQGRGNRYFHHGNVSPSLRNILKQNKNALVLHRCRENASRAFRALWANLSDSVCLVVSRNLRHCAYVLSNNFLSKTKSSSIRNILRERLVMSAGAAAWRSPLEKQTRYTSRAALCHLAQMFASSNVTKGGEQLLRLSFSCIQNGRKAARAFCSC